MDWAIANMEGKGWSRGEGLGRHGQGITDAIKPKLKFDQAGVGHSKAAEFEFQWWDHVFNKAAATVVVEEGGDGEVKVDFNSSKDELSTKKIRRKAEKKMRASVKAKLYGNFVKSGTLTGGVMEEEADDSGFVEDKDKGSLKALTDEELVKACGGRTAHKGGRHGHRMDAKLARIEAAEVEYMENHRRREEEKEEAKKAEEQKKKKKKLEKEEAVAAVEEVVVKKKKSKKREVEAIEESRVEGELENLEPTEVPEKKKKSKKSKRKLEEAPTEEAEASLEEQQPRKKKKKKCKGGSD